MKKRCENFGRAHPDDIALTSLKVLPNVVTMCIKVFEFVPALFVHAKFKFMLKQFSRNEPLYDLP